MIKVACGNYCMYVLLLSWSGIIVFWIHVSSFCFRHNTFILSPNQSYYFCYRALEFLLDRHRNQLTHLDVDGAELSDTSMLHISRCPKMKHFGISFAELFTDDDLLYIKVQGSNIFFKLLVYRTSGSNFTYPLWNPLALQDIIYNVQGTRIFVQASCLTFSLFILPCLIS